MEFDSTKLKFLKSIYIYIYIASEICWLVLLTKIILLKELETSWILWNISFFPEFILPVCHLDFGMPLLSTDYLHELQFSVNELMASGYFMLHKKYSLHPCVLDVRRIHVPWQYKLAKKKTELPFCDHKLKFNLPSDLQVLFLYIFSL